MLSLVKPIGWRVLKNTLFNKSVVEKLNFYKTEKCAMKSVTSVKCLFGQGNEQLQESLSYV